MKIRFRVKASKWGAWNISQDASSFWHKGVFDYAPMKFLRAWLYKK